MDFHTINFDILNLLVIEFYSDLRKDFEKRMEERERIEEMERIKYRQQLDYKADQEKEKIADFYKDVEKFQVIII